MFGIFFTLILIIPRAFKAIICFDSIISPFESIKSFFLKSCPFNLTFWNFLIFLSILINFGFNLFGKKTTCSIGTIASISFGKIAPVFIPIV